MQLNKSREILGSKPGNRCAISGILLIQLIWALYALRLTLIAVILLNHFAIGILIISPPSLLTA